MAEAPPTTDTGVRRRRWIAYLLQGVVIAALFLGLPLFMVMWPGNGDEQIAGLPADAKMFSASKTMDCGVTDAGLEQLAREHPDLEVLSLTQCPQVTNEGVKQVGRLKSLTELTLQGRPGFDESALQYLRGCEKLEKLGLAGVDIGKDGANFIAELPNLKSLCLSRDHVSEAALEILDKRHPGIEIRWL
jgi:hypothetical protein